MNMIMLLILVLVLCAYFLPSSPKILKENKQILLGIVIGLILCFFKGDLVEGYWLYSANGCTQLRRRHSRHSPPDDRSCEEVGRGDDERCFDAGDDTAAGLTGELNQGGKISCNVYSYRNSGRGR